MSMLVLQVMFQEELSAKLLEFLESPHATTDVLLADREQVLYCLYFFVKLMEQGCMFFCLSCLAVVKSRPLTDF